MIWRVLFASVPLVSTAEAVVNTSWVLGNICAGIDRSTPAQDMLRGQHLRILETPWVPYAQPDDSAASGWVGLNIDVINLVSADLGFTFEIVDMGAPASGASWTDHLIVTVNEADLIMSYWTAFPPAARPARPGRPAGPRAPAAAACRCGAAASAAAGTALGVRLAQP